jgi:hypothetical protein
MRYARRDGSALLRAARFRGHVRMCTPGLVEVIVAWVFRVEEGRNEWSCQWWISSASSP